LPPEGAAIAPWDGPAARTENPAGGRGLRLLQGNAQLLAGLVLVFCGLGGGFVFRPLVLRRLRILVGLGLFLLRLFVGRLLRLFFLRRLRLFGFLGLGLFFRGFLVVGFLGFVVAGSGLGGLLFIRLAHLGL